MTELIKIETKNGKQTVSARELHEKLGASTQFKDWIKRMVDYGFEEGKDYTKFSLFFNSIYKKIVKESDLNKLIELRNIARDSYFLFKDNSIYVTDIINNEISYLKEVLRNNTPRKGKSIVYLIKNDNLIKIGRTTNIERRLSEIKLSAPNAEIVAVKVCKDGVMEESYWHKYFQNKRYKREWFSLDESDLKYCYKNGFIRNKDNIGLSY